MALSKLQANVKRLYELNTERKRLEKEEKALKAFFSEEAGGEPTDFTWKDVTVSVTQGSSTRIDLDKLRIDLGDGIKKYEMIGDTEKVTVRKDEKAKAAG